jgi:hypothetical protein
VIRDFAYRGEINTNKFLLIETLEKFEKITPPNLPYFSIVASFSSSAENFVKSVIQIILFSK